MIKRVKYRFNKIVAIERNIRNVVVSGIPIKGKLDKLERSPQLWPDYINGVLEQFRMKNFALGGLNIVIGGDNNTPLIISTNRG